MNTTSQHFLEELLSIASPTGAEQKIQRRIHQEFKDIAHRLEPDVHGNLIMSLNPDARQTVMLAGHCDQIGFLVKYISPEGFIYLDQLGGNRQRCHPRRASGDSHRKRKTRRRDWAETIASATRQ